MTIMANKWNRKEVKKLDLKTLTAPSYASQKIDDAIPFNGRHPKRHTQASRATLVKTLRGVRR